MAVKRIVTNIASKDIDRASAFYSDILDMNLVMSHGWIVTFAGEGWASPEISIASEGGSGTDVPDISIEVDNLDEVLQRVVLKGIPVVYGPAIEPWGVRRFYLRDPFDRLLNVLSHEDR